ncbi:MAG TPA: hypothetical protein PKN64_17235 [Casimicrobium sp.]|mgnify:CR=1 FL=1|nr:hypothetical protein [Casimicrobium sp.]
MIVVRRILFTLFSIALAVQGVAAATMLHSPAMRSMTSSASAAHTVARSSEATPSVDESAAAAAGVASDCEHMHGAVTADGVSSGQHNSHNQHADCAGALCCAAFMPLSITVFRLPPARLAPADAAQCRAVDFDPATFDRPPRT